MSANGTGADSVRVRHASGVEGVEARNVAGASRCRPGLLGLLGLRANLAMVQYGRGTCSCGVVVVRVIPFLVRCIASHACLGFMDFSTPMASPLLAFLRVLISYSQYFRAGTWPRRFVWSPLGVPNDVFQPAGRALRLALTGNSRFQLPSNVDGSSWPRYDVSYRVPLRA